MRRRGSREQAREQRESGRGKESRRRTLQLDCQSPCGNGVRMPRWASIHDSEATMSDPTPFPTDPLDTLGTDPDLSKDDDLREQSADDEDRPDDRPPTHDEQQRDRTAAREQAKTEEYPGIA